MSDEALGVDDGGGNGTVAGTLPGNATVPDVNASTSAAPSLAGVCNPASISLFVSAPTLNAN